MLESMDQECNSIREDCLRISWNMRGGASYTDVMNMSVAERTTVGKIIKENYDVVKKTGLPYF